MNKRMNERHTLGLLIVKCGNLGNFFMIWGYVNLRTFFNPENRFADKNQLFPCLILSKRPVMEIHKKATNLTNCKGKVLSFRHASACLTLLYNTAEENLRGMKE